MEDLHRTHKDVVSGWALVLDDWRRSRTRRRLRAVRRFEAAQPR